MYFFENVFLLISITVSENRYGKKYRVENANKTHTHPIPHTFNICCRVVAIFLSLSLIHFSTLKRLIMNLSHTRTIPQLTLDKLKRAPASSSSLFVGFDWFDFLIEKPRDQGEKAQTYSQHKHHHSV